MHIYTPKTNTYPSDLEFADLALPLPLLVSALGLAGRPRLGAGSSDPDSASELGSGDGFLAFLALVFAAKQQKIEHI